MTEPAKRPTNSLLNRTLIIMVALAVIFLIFQLLPRIGATTAAEPSFEWGTNVRNVHPLGVDSSALRMQQYRLQGNSPIPTYEFDHCTIQSNYVGVEAAPDNEFVLSSSLAGFNSETDSITETTLLYENEIAVPAIIKVDEAEHKAVIARVFGIENLQLQITIQCDDEERLTRATQSVINGGVQIREGQSVL